MKSFALLALAFASACHRHQPAPAPAVAEAPVVAEEKIGQPGTLDTGTLAQLPNMLGGEAKDRPAATKVSIEHLFSALDAKGIKLVSQHQVLAAAAAASYCSLGVTKDTVAIAVCEYPTHEQAVAGAKMMNERYAKLTPDAVREVNGNTLVTVANASHHRDVRDQVLETFKAL
ncbi:MAG: hypothetical protein ABI591_06560 [Kofleriaceae bacterium]